MRLVVVAFEHAYACLRGPGVLSYRPRRIVIMPAMPDPAAYTPAELRLVRAQAQIRALTARGRLSPAERLELAAWQREWVAAWREGQYVIAA